MAEENLKKDAEEKAQAETQTETPAEEIKKEAGGTSETDAAGAEKAESNAGGSGAEPDCADGDKKTACGCAAEEANETEDKTADSSESKKPDAKDQKIEELTDKYKRLFAEFDNFRKRNEAEKSGMYAEGQRSILEKILPIIDNFERALGSVPEELKGNGYVDGMEKIYRSAADTLKALGVEPIEAVGQTFDANLHNAVMHIEDEAHGENEIVEEFQKGYKFKDKVLRYSMVKVAN